VEVNGFGQILLVRTPTPADLERVAAEDLRDRVASLKVRVWQRVWELRKFWQML